MDQYRVCEIINANKKKVMEWLDFDISVSGHIDISRGTIYVTHIGNSGSVVRSDHFVLGESKVSFCTRPHTYREYFNNHKMHIKSPIQCSTIPTQRDIISAFHCSIQSRGPVWNVIISEFGLTFYGPNNTFIEKIPEWVCVYSRRTSRIILSYISETVGIINRFIHHSANPTWHTRIFNDAIAPGEGFTVKYVKW